MALLRWTGRLRRYGLGPGLLLLFLGLLALNLGSADLLERHEIQLLAGDLPEVTHRLGFHGVLSCLLALLACASLVLAMREWARYYLNRKLVLSYLVLALFPFLSTFIIYFLGARALFGIISANSVENTMSRVAGDLHQFTATLTQETAQLLDSGIPQDPAATLQPIVEKARATRLGTLAYSALQVEIYFGGDYLLRIYPESQFLADPEPIVPAWLSRTSATNLLQREDRLFIQRFQRTPSVGGDLFVLTTLPVNQAFISYLRETLDVDILLDHPRGLWRHEAMSRKGMWIFRQLFRPFRSRWELMALDWNSGAYQPGAYIQFQIAPDTLLSQWGEKEVHFFGDGEKKVQFWTILAVILVLLLAQFSAFVFGIYLVSYITRSLNTLALGHEKVAKGQLEYRLPAMGQDQIGTMSQSFNHMVGNLNFLLHEVREKEKYQEELRIAREIQMSLLPNTDRLPFPESVTATCLPAQDVGGDYYDVLLTAEGKIGLFIADVSGKGTSAAFYMAELKGVLIALRQLWGDPAALMLAINEIITPALEAKVFISAAYLMLDPATCRGQLARAGHSPALLVKSDGTIETLQPHGMALGLAGNAVFGKILKICEFQLSSQDKIVLYTDGLDEMNRGEELYGMVRLRRVVAENAAQSAKNLKEAILRDVLAFLADAKQNDDLTLLVASLPESA